ncbi:MAG: 50S ribosomal protein L5 [Elusimicrobia bacterium CG_4_9_14_3_um_filter_62_55]|nr:MAG: 50S ribosomal protein L5 [Elusimicrobia bacterium CG22_combo_CG10-13_8_21_14_all_63_91]PJA12519.1 MAG: 50S ribosomal protein L5 [Elusimicrobia bacterium CG_4_10_14_0_2_um_filter_63_34]PJB25275.1 MAG: 50S ribosomal protein L5 [Elusimicrobia bacterium CG_4_9_14_3_um_filter_62_55]
MAKETKETKKMKKEPTQKAEKKSAIAVGVFEKGEGLPRLKKHYNETVLPGMLKDLNRSNRFQVPRLQKVVVSMGVNEAKENIQVLDSARDELGQITGQLPQIRRAKKSISNFKLREGMPLGLRVTLRGDRMWEFVDRLISVAVPRIRDFRGLEPRGFDGNGNYNLGLKEHHIFPETSLERAPTARGMNITFVTSAENDDDGRELLNRMGLPFKKKGGQE